MPDRLNGLPASGGTSTSARRTPSSTGSATPATAALARLGLGHIVELLPLVPFIPVSLSYSVPPFLNQQCDRTLGALQRRVLELYARVYAEPHFAWHA